MKVSITAGAEADLLAIWRRRRAQRGDDGADSLLAGLASKMEGLADFPERGAIPPELEALGIAEFRQIGLPPYRIIYRLSGEAVMIMIVADARRDFRTLLEERLLRSN